MWVSERMSVACMSVCAFGVDGWIFGCTNAVKTTSARMLANLSHLCTAR